MLRSWVNFLTEYTLFRYYILVYFVTYADFLQTFYCQKSRSFEVKSFSLNHHCVKQMTFIVSGLIFEGFQVRKGIYCKPG